jgi:hypothetical protein
MLAIRGRRVLAAVLLVEAACMVGYWTAWFVDPAALAASTSREYAAFEAAFPLPDAWVVACLVTTARCVLRSSPYAVFWALAGAGAGMFLALVDIAFDVRHGLWATGPEGWLEAAIVAVILATSVTVGALGLGWLRQLIRAAAGGPVTA